MMPGLSRLTWRHPEWWSLALSGVAWALLLARHSFGGAGPHASGNQHDHLASAAPSHAAEAAFAWGPETATWALMVVAMMVPLVLGPIVTTAARSLWSRRSRAIAGFLTGYVGLWILVGAAFLGGVASFEPERWLRSPGVVLGGFVVAAGWQLTPHKRRALVGCHRTIPLAPRGWRADRDCVRYGWMIGVRCLASCWALMLVCVLSGHAVVVMVAVGIMGLVERVRPRPNQRLNAALLSGLAIVSVTGVVG